MTIGRYGWWAVLGAAVACSSSGGGSGTGNDDGSAGASAGSTGNLFGDGGVVASGGTGGGAAGRPGGNVKPGEECAGSTLAGEQIPVDMHVMMDRSVSMGDDQDIYLIPGGGTKWAAVREGFDTFVRLPEVAGLGMGIDFFGQESGDTRCDPDTYATPEVEVQDLPGVGNAILAAYDSFSPGNNTPLTPALEGAIRHARQWQRDNPARQGVVVLVTDGVPNGCGSDLDNLVAAARDGAQGMPSVKTFVLGITGQELDVATFRAGMLDVANAGDGEAVFVDANTDLAQEFSRGLDAIRGTAFLPCVFTIPDAPPGEDLDFGRINVTFTPPNGMPDSIFKVGGEADCGSDAGWFYDDDNAPSTIRLCPASCDEVGASLNATIEIQLGCATVQRVN